MVSDNIYDPYYQQEDDEFHDLPSLETVHDDEAAVNPAEEDEEEGEVIPNDEVERQNELEAYYQEYIGEQQYQYLDDLYSRESIFMNPPRQVQSEHLSETLYRTLLSSIVSSTGGINVDQN
jgi:hypothetical protein